jgi:hypothetical protein
MGSGISGMGMFVASAGADWEEVLKGRPPEDQAHPK